MRVSELKDVLESLGNVVADAGEVREGVLECVVLGDIETIQAGMVYTETDGDGEEEDGPLGRGRGGERP